MVQSGSLSPCRKVQQHYKEIKKYIKVTLLLPKSFSSETRQVCQAFFILHPDGHSQSQQFLYGFHQLQLAQFHNLIMLYMLVHHMFADAQLPSKRPGFGEKTFILQRQANPKKERNEKNLQKNTIGQTGLPHFRLKEYIYIINFTQFGGIQHHHMTNTWFIM